MNQNELFWLQLTGSKKPMILIPTIPGLAAGVSSLTAAFRSGAAAAAGGTSETVVATSASILSAAAKTMSGAGAAFKFLEARLNSLFLAALVSANFLDFGNWTTGAYSDTFQKIFEKVSFGLLKPNEDYRQTKTASPEVFDKVYNTYKIEGAVGIEDPNKRQSVLFTRDNLIDLIDVLGAQLLLSTGSASTKDVLLASQLFIIFSAPTTEAPASAKPATVAATKSISVSVPQTKIFTGILSQGTLGEGLTFTPRPDDMIESIDELRDAAQNNLAPFLVALPSKIIYEIKVVSSVTTRDGFKQTGAAQQILTSYKSDGTPVYKTVYNKFATLTLYFLTDRGVKSKLATIILGPTDSVKLNPAQNVLRALEGTIQKTVVSTDISDIDGIETTTPITVKPPKAEKQPSAPAPTKPETKVSGYIVDPETYNYLTRALWMDGTDTTYQGERYRRTNGQIIHSETGQVVAAAKGATTSKTPAAASAPAARPGSGAKNLSEWYAANGQSLPPISSRAQIYESKGLGKATMYTGTAEQNTRLLAALKA